jgi:hypothetical protein
MKRIRKPSRGKVTLAEINDGIADRLESEAADPASQDAPGWLKSAAKSFRGRARKKEKALEYKRSQQSLRLD